MRYPDERIAGAKLPGIEIQTKIEADFVSLIPVKIKKRQGRATSSIQNFERSGFAIYPVNQESHSFVDHPVASKKRVAKAEMPDKKGIDRAREFIRHGSVACASFRTIPELSAQSPLEHYQ